MWTLLFPDAAGHQIILNVIAVQHMEEIGARGTIITESRNEKWIFMVVRPVNENGNRSCEESSFQGWKTEMTPGPAPCVYCMKSRKHVSCPLLSNNLMLPSIDCLIGRDKVEIQSLYYQIAHLIEEIPPHTSIQQLYFLKFLKLLAVLFCNIFFIFCNYCCIQCEYNNAILNAVYYVYVYRTGPRTMARWTMSDSPTEVCGKILNPCRMVRQFRPATWGARPTSGCASRDTTAFALLYANDKAYACSSVWWWPDPVTKWAAIILQV